MSSAMPTKNEEPALAAQPSAPSRHILIVYFLLPVVMLIGAYLVLGNTFEYALLLCAGVSNVIAIRDIVRQEPTYTSWVVRSIFNIELLFFDFLIGLDVWLFFRDFEGARLLLSFAAVFTCMAIHAIRPEKDAYAPVFLLFLLALSLVPQAADICKEPLHELSRGMASLVHIDDVEFLWIRKYSWLHLLAVPLVYTLADFAHSRVKEVKNNMSELLQLDVVLLVVGALIVMLGLKVKVPYFEAAAAAVVLLLGNFYYATLTRK